MRTLLAPLAVLTALATVPTTAAAQKLEGRKWTHEKLGIQMTIPEGFDMVPLQTDEQWILAKFLSKKTYLSKDKEWNWEHRPLMRIIAFTEKAKAGSAAEVHEEKDGSTFIGIGAVPYKGYRDYVKRHRRGFFFSAEDDGKIGGERCLMCEVDVHKATPKLHLFSAVFHRPTFELAVEFEVLEDRHDKLGKACLKALKSVRFKEPVRVAEAAVTGGRKTSTRLWTAFRDEWRKRSYEERYEIRQQMERQSHDAVKAKTPDDWIVQDSKHFLVISHADDGFTKRMVAASEVFYTWCEKNFGKLGDDYVRRPVLRICKDFDEYSAYHFDSSNTTGWSFSGESAEIGTYYDNWNGTSGRDSRYLFDGILRWYLQEKDPYIVSYTPYWLTWSISDYLDGAFVKGKKLTFKVDDWTRDESRAMARDGKLPKLQTLLEMDSDGFSKLRKQDSRASYAATQALRYVLGPGQRVKPLKKFLPRYFQAAITVAENDDKKVAPINRLTAKTEEEEEAMAKAATKRRKDRKKRLQQEINDLMLSKITAKDWKKLEKGFAEFVKKGK
ncbi:MAG: hypothetical protein NXI31_07470 [bacterium]|nr:hypothetical protein [bacterium]